MKYMVVFVILLMVVCDSALKIEVNIQETQPQFIPEDFFYFPLKTIIRQQFSLPKLLRFFFLGAHGRPMARK